MYRNEMIWIAINVLILNLIFVSSRVISHNEYVPKGCDWETERKPDGSLEVQTEPVLTCQIRTINGVDSLMANMSPLLADLVENLKLECSDVFFFESTLESKREKPFLSHLKRLKELRIEYCKIRNVPPAILSSMHHLRSLSLRSHNSDWSVMTLELHRESFLGMSQLRSLDLGDNNIWTTPQHLFCPLYSLERLNLTKNKLQDVISLGFNEIDEMTHSRSCGNSLDILDLSDNDIISIPDHSFANLKSLRTLSLQNNAISSLGDRAFSNLKNLQTINMSSNSIVALPPELFHSSRSLNHLYLQNNSLSVLAPGILEGLDQLQVVDLSHNELSSRWINRDAFKGLVRLVELNLGYNSLNKIDGNVFRDLFSLQILNLERNQIETIVEGAFGQLSNLHALILSHNRLQTIEAFHLNGMYALNQLILDFNYIKIIDDQSFENITNLQDLGLNGNQLDSVPDGIKKLRYLKSLDLGKNLIRSVNNSSFEGLDQVYGLRLVDNHISNISRDAFSTLPSLKVLNLASNRIKHVEQSAFSSNSGLKAILLDNNQLTDISGVFTNLESLIWLNVSANNLNIFDFGHLPLNLQGLDLRNNQITELNDRFDVVNSSNIKFFDVSFNYLSEINQHSVPAKIEEFFLNNNRIKSIEPNSFLNKQNLKKVVLSYNEIKNLDISSLNLGGFNENDDLPQFYLGNNPFYCDCNMEWLLRINHLSSNLRQYPQILDLDSVNCDLVHSRGSPPQKLLDLKPSQFLCEYKTHCFALCHCCDFDACDCEMTCPNNCTCFHDLTWSSNVVDCSNAGYRNVPEKIPMDATEIYLDGNDLGELGSHVFIGKKKLEVLFLNNSNILNIHNRTFNGVKSLKILHMENNHLEELRGFEFDQLQKLNELYLDHNKISFVGNQTFNAMKELGVLKLDDNEIVNFNNPFDKLKETETQPKITLDGNKWSCECENLLKLESWLKENVETNPDKHLCQNRKETVAEVLHKCDNDVNAVATVMQKKILTNNILLGGNYIPLLAASLVTLIILFLIFSIIFAFRQDFKLWIHSKYGLRIFKKSTGEIENFEENDRLYDCYMVYSYKDEELANRIIGPDLEAHGYTLCLHYRDLHLVGGASYLVDAMVGAADASKRVIFVVSPSLLSNEWQRPEFRAALQTAITTRFRYKLICILYGEPLEPMDPELRALLRACSVTRWGERRFWEKLRYFMPDFARNNRLDRRFKKNSIDLRNQISSRYTSPPTAVPESWKYSTITPTQSTYVSGESSRSTEDEGVSSTNSSQHYGSEINSHSYMSIDGRPPQYSLEFPSSAPNGHVYSTIPESQQPQQTQTRTYFV
nr:toll-like receptor 6 [Onthophagus taurus]